MVQQTPSHKQGTVYISTPNPNFLIFLSYSGYIDKFLVINPEGILAIFACGALGGDFTVISL